MADVTVTGISLAYEPGVDAVDDVTLTVPHGRSLALLGPSGCGKTSLLRTIAGFERPQRGEVAIGGRTVTGPRVWVPPEQRQLGMVFQEPALFPHLDVASNVAFGLRELSPAVRRSRVDEMLELVGLTEYRSRRPGTLSGGQQQRVALARSLAPRPQVLLLDEPFSALDAGLRVSLRSDVMRIIREVGVTAVFVTHDQSEAFVMGDLVGVLNGGRLEQLDTPARIYDEPATPWVATFVGDANVVRGRAEGATASSALGALPLRVDRRGDVEVLVRPEQLRVEPAADGAGDGVVTAVEFYGHDCRYEIALDTGGAMVARHGGTAVAAIGERVSVRPFGSSYHTFVAPLPGAPAAAPATAAPAVTDPR